MRIVVALTLSLIVCSAISADETSEHSSEPSARVLPGMRPDGRVQLPTQWSLKPVGKQIALGDLPVNIAVHPGGDFAAILHAGYGENEVAIIDLKKERVVSRVSIPQAFYGLLWDAAGERLFASGGEYEVVHRFAFKDGYLSEHVELRIVDQKEKFVPAGLALAADGKTLFVAGAWGDKIALVDPTDLDAKPRFIDLQ